MELSVDKFTFITYLAKRLVLVKLGNDDVSTETYLDEHKYDSFSFIFRYQPRYHFTNKYSFLHPRTS